MPERGPPAWRGPCADQTTLMRRFSGLPAEPRFFSAWGRQEERPGSFPPRRRAARRDRAAIPTRAPRAHRRSASARAARCHRGMAIPPGAARWRPPSSARRPPPQDPRRLVDAGATGGVQPRREDVVVLRGVAGLDHDTDVARGDVWQQVVAFAIVDAGGQRARTGIVEAADGDRRAVPGLAIDVSACKRWIACGNVSTA